MTKFIETLNNLLKLISSLITLAVLGGVIFGGLWLYKQYVIITSQPIKLPSVVLPDIQMPKIKIEAPEIKLPTVELPAVKVGGITVFGKSDEEIAKDKQEEEDWAWINSSIQAAKEGIKPKEEYKSPFKLDTLPPANCKHSPQCKNTYDHDGKDYLETRCDHAPRCTVYDGCRDKFEKDLYRWCPVQHNGTCPDAKHHLSKWWKEVRAGKGIIESCDHEPGCTSLYSHKAKMDFRLCSHFPKCEDVSTFCERHAEEFFYYCTHTPKCSDKKMHFDALYGGDSGKE